MFAIVNREKVYDTGGDSLFLHVPGGGGGSLLLPWEAH